MPPAPKPPHVFRRKDRPGSGFWAYLSRDDKRRQLHTDDEEEALRRLADLVRERGRVAAAPAGDARLLELIAITVERARAANTPKTAYELELNLNRVAAWLEERGIATVRQVTQSHVEDFKTARRFSVGAARINRELDSWKRLHREAVKEGIDAPLGWFGHLREPRPAPHQQRATKRDLQAFLRAAPLPYRHLFRAVLGCALRDEEVRHLEAEDVRAASVMVTPKPGWTTKGYRYREVPASRETVRALRAWLAARGSVSTDKKAIWKVAMGACEAAGVERLSLHDLRHACASHWLAAGAKVAQISRWLGHADLLTTLRYLGIVEEEKFDTTKLPW